MSAQVQLPHAAKGDAVGAAWNAKISAAKGMPLPPGRCWVTLQPERSPRFGTLDPVSSQSPRGQPGAAMLVPALGQAPTWQSAPMGPALVRGSGPRKPRKPSKKSLWPHNVSSQSYEQEAVELRYLSSRRAKRVLLVSREGDRPQQDAALVPCSQSSDTVTVFLSRPMDLQCDQSQVSVAVSRSAPSLSDVEAEPVLAHLWPAPLTAEASCVSGSTVAAAIHDQALQETQVKSDELAALATGSRSVAHEAAHQDVQAASANEEQSKLAQATRRHARHMKGCPLLGQFQAQRCQAAKGQDLGAKESGPTQSVFQEAWEALSAPHLPVERASGRSWAPDPGDVPAYLPPIRCAEATSSSSCPSASLSLGQQMATSASLPALSTTGFPVEWVHSFIARPPLGILPEKSPRARRTLPMFRSMSESRSESSLKKAKLVGLPRSIALMNSHYDLRRAGKPELQRLLAESASESPKKPCRPGCEACPHFNGIRKEGVPPQNLYQHPEDEMSGVDKVVGDCQDTVESLLAAISDMQSFEVPITEDFGGMRHPTTLIYNKALRAARRKLAVLTPLTDATRQFVAMSERKDEVIDAVVHGQSVEEAGGEALGYPAKVKAAIHKKPWGDPLQADRSFFEYFCSTFKLPRNHDAVKNAEKLLETEEQAWVEALASRARLEFDKEVASDDVTAESPAGEAVKRLSLLGEGIGLPDDNPKMLKTEMLAKAAKARKVRISAEALFAKAMKSSQVSTMHKAAKEVAENVKSAAAWMIEKSHPDMKAAQNISYDLRAGAVKLAAEDEARLKDARNKLGDAEKAAVRIEDWIKECTQLGCPVDHPDLKAATKIAQEFRQEEGIRKRLANRQKAQAEKAAREAATK